MNLRKTSSHRASSPKGRNHKAGPKKFFSLQPARSYGQRTHIKNKSKKKK